jgi:hypothetical protein
VITGWFSEFTALTSREREGRTTYGTGGDRFAGATYDPASHYRAARVFTFFAEHGLSPDLLREVSQHQIGVLAKAFDGLGLDPALISRDRSAPLSEIGGFLALKAPGAGQLASLLHRRKVMVDWRGDILRFGPAPYLSDEQLETAIALLGEVARSLSTDEHR